MIEKPEHRAAILVERQAARALKGRDRLRSVVPTFDRIVEGWAVSVSGSSLGLRVTRTINLLELYGDDVFVAAVADLEARGLADVGALALACERHRKGQRRLVPIDLVFPDHLDDTDMIPHDLESYDE